MKMKKEKILVFLIVAFLVLIVSDGFLYFFCPNASWIFGAQKYFQNAPVLLQARKFYQNENIQLKIDEYILWRKIVQLDGGFENKKLKEGYEKETRKNPFYGMLDGGADLNVDIKRNFENVDDLKNFVSDKEYLENRFYEIEGGKEYLEDPWDDVLLKALYCKSTGYDGLDWKVMELLNDGKGGYLDTHFLLGLLFLENGKCFDEAEIKKVKSRVIDEIVLAQERDEKFSDLYAERIVFLYWAGEGEKVEKEWINLIQANFQNESNGWQDIGRSEVDAHTTGMAILALEYFLKNPKSQLFLELTR